MSRVYISGPITGVPDYRRYFTIAARAVTDRNDEPVNPCDVPPECGANDGSCGSDEGHKWACWMRSDLRALLDCDAILMLPGWENSRGAQLERQVALALGLAEYPPLIGWPK